MRNLSMDASRGRILLGSALAIGLLASSWALPVAAAGCELSAPATGRVGSILAVNGSGFPSSSTIDIELTVVGGKADEFSVQSDSSGAFEITLTPETIDEGATTVVATAGSVCTAQVQFTILGENEPAPSAEPEQAGPAASAAPGAPTTDAVATVPGDAAPGLGAWLVGGLLLAMGVVGWLATRPARDDRSSR
jgi:hypothetical protein